MRITDTQDGARLHVHVQPRASRTEIAGEHADSLKIRIAAPPVDGEANAELERFVAKLLGIARSRVQVVSGESSRQKVLDISGVSAEAVGAAIANAMKPGK